MHWPKVVTGWCCVDKHQGGAAEGGKPSVDANKQLLLRCKGIQRQA